MDEDEIRQPLPDVVPALSEPTEGLAVRRGRARVGPAVTAAVAGVALAGALLSVRAPHGRLENAAAQPHGQTSTTAAHPNAQAVTSAAPPNGRAVTTRPTVQVTVSTFANPVVSQAYVTVSPGPDTAYPVDPPRDAPLPRSGTCPTSVDLIRLPIHNPWDATTWPRQVTAVTLCRYEHSTSDPGTGHNTLTQGPVKGNLAVFGAALDKALAPVRPIDHRGCRVANPDPPYTVDIVFVTASGGTGKAYIMFRMLCDPPWLEDPERTLDEAVDTVLGPPY